MAAFESMLASAVIKIVVQELSCTIRSNIKMQKNFKKDLEKMRNTLESVEAVLKDAEKRSINDAAVRLWMERLKKAMYDISDMVNEFETNTEVPAGQKIDWLHDKDVTLFTMHDLVHDLARSVMADEILDASKQKNMEGGSCRYALLTDCSNSLKLTAISPIKIRTIRFLDCGKSELCDAAFLSAKYLCVLDLSECSIKKFPDSVEQLKQLSSLAELEHANPDGPRISRLEKLRTVSEHDIAASMVRKTHPSQGTLIFGEEDDDLLLPVEALIPEEVALLGHEATVHLVREEDPVGVAGGPSPGDDHGDDRGDNRGGGGFGRPRDNGGARPPRRDPPGPDCDARPPGRLAQALSRRWRGGSERRVAVGFSTTIRPWPRRDGSDVGELGLQQQVEGTSATLGAEQSLVRWPVGGAGQSPSPAGSSNSEMSVGCGGSDPSSGKAASLGGVGSLCEPHQRRSESSPSIHAVDRGPRWPKGSLVLWAVGDELQSPRGPLLT
ncbi:hypothetical protein ACQ4PT_068671 [Festuca glaucescens]